MTWLEGGLVAYGRGLPGRDVTLRLDFPWGSLVSRMPAARDFHALLADACFVSPEELANCREGWLLFYSAFGILGVPGFQPESCMSPSSEVCNPHLKCHFTLCSPWLSSPTPVGAHKSEEEACCLPNCPTLSFTVTAKLLLGALPYPMLSL